MSRYLILSLLNLITLFSAAQTPLVHSGSIQHIERFNSTCIEPRNIDIWLPDGYDEHQKYAVIYMHDGQMLFDSAHNWNHQEWQVDETLGELVKQQLVKPCIVVGIWNTGDYRTSDYIPEKALNLIPDSIRTDWVNRELKGKPRADAYLKFITTELKPYIDNHFSTLTDAANTCIAGSSKGGLISLYAICEYPNIFGKGACLSTHWIGSTIIRKKEIGEALLNYFSAHLPSPKNHVIYFDRGTITLDSLYGDWQKQADQMMIRHGYRRGR